jgi:hypothetical protein
MLDLHPWASWRHYCSFARNMASLAGYRVPILGVPEHSDICGLANRTRDYCRRQLLAKAAMPVVQAASFEFKINLGGPLARR